MPLPAGPNDPRDTPAMRQYRRFKEQYPDCVLFFRMGDFYEMFDDDALLAHRVLGVTLTQRTEGIPMAGVPYHSLETYLRRMLQAGYRVAVCDQVEDPALAKGIVERQVTRLVTPGTLTDEALLDEARPNPLLAILWPQRESASGTARSLSHHSAASAPLSAASSSTIPVAWVELSTGTFHVAELPSSLLADELARIAPREILFPHDDPHAPAPTSLAQLAANLSCPLTPRPSWQFHLEEARQILFRQFQVATLAGFGLSDQEPLLAPAGAILHYLLETQRSPTGQPLQRIEHLQPPRRFERSRHLIIDQVSLRSLEVERTLRTGSTEGSLLGIFNDCRTPMGKRLLRQWLCFPLCDRSAIEARQRVVEALVQDPPFLAQLRDALDLIQDVERILGRLGVNRAWPRDIVALGQSAAQGQKLLALLQDRPALADYHHRLAAVASDLTDLAQHIRSACVEHPPAHLREGGVFRDGFDAQLDEYRALQRDSQHWLARYQKQLIEETGIPSLKVGFNKVFGFYIELTAANRDKAPASWTRKQTLKNAERFITPELKDYEQKVLSAESRAIAREQELFDQLCQFCRRRIEPLRQLAHVTAELDVLACFARRALRKRYVRPILVDQPVLIIRAGRHPVLDEILGDQFVPNDLTLGPDPDSPASNAASASSSAPTLALITGPNMAGKSTFIRQAALITLLAHTGSFVPADQAIIGLTDRIFTRVGASDELHAGASTFMVEMTEAANICHHATDRSLVILDEIGRGTSTLDGLALAWAIGEYLAQRRCRTLFATHYHEITALAESFPNVVNLHVTVREWADQIIFLHRVQPGATDRSYGIHVAKLAGLPQPIIQRASQLLTQLEVNHRPATTRPSPQLPLFREYLEHPALQRLRQVNLDQLTPLQAFDLLRQLLQTLDQS